MVHLEKQKDSSCAHEYALTVSNRFEVLDALKNPVELWDTFKRETLEAARGCLRSRVGFASAETLNSIVKSFAARPAGSRDQYRALSRWTRTLLRRDNERYFRRLAEDVDGYLNANDLKPAYRALKKHHSKSKCRVSSIRKADGCLVSDTDGQMVRWAEYSEQFFKVNPLSGRLQTTGL